MEELKRILLKNGAGLVGFADLDDLSLEVRENMRFGISLAVPLNPEIIAKIIDGPTGEYYAEYLRANELLSKLASWAVQFLNQQGFKAKGLAPTNVGIDWSTHSTKLPHKTVATKAGLGWIGKCALLVTKQFGPAIRLTTVLTEAKLPVNQPIENSLCGDCVECVKICPGNAPSGKNWGKGMYRDNFFNAEACSQCAKMMAKRVGIDQTICGMCIAVCPWTQNYIKKFKESG
jgi:epoxyqueuosine reductase